MNKLLMGKSKIATKKKGRKSTRPVPKPYPWDPMPPRKHLSLWLRGATVWNRWRKFHPDVHPWLPVDAASFKRDRFQNFDGFDLSDLRIRCQTINHVSFKGACLSNMLAESATFENCDFTGANLDNACLEGATLLRCKFDHANLRRASFEYALLRSSEFPRANFEKAIFGVTDIVNANLMRAAGLGATVHRAPSTIDLKTLAQPLHEHFLRGIGLSNTAIDARSSLGSFAGEFRSCFISYSSKDQAFAARLYKTLQENGVRCWFAPHDLPLGAKTLHDIDRQITNLDCLLLILSNASIRSGWVEDEVYKAYAEERRRDNCILVPIRIDDEVMKTSKPWAIKLRDQRNIGDFRNWQSRSRYPRLIERLTHDLRLPNSQ